MSIFVGNLPFRAEREDVLQLFAPFGEVLNCSLPLERDTGRKEDLHLLKWQMKQLKLRLLMVYKVQSLWAAIKNQ